MQGILNGTALITTPGMLGCIDASNFIYTGTERTLSLLESNMTLYGSMLAFNAFLDPVYHIADINYQCFIGGQEASYIGGKYGTLFTNPALVGANLFWNFGLIFNSAKEIGTYFANPARCTSPTPLDLGVQFG
jgi:hypothetical protein